MIAVPRPALTVSWRLLGHLDLHRFHQLCQLLCRIRFRQGRVDDHAQVWCVSDLECGWLEDQPSNKGMIQFFFPCMSGLKGVLRPPRAELRAGELQLCYQCLEPGLSNVPFSTGTKQSQQALRCLLPVGEERSPGGRGERQARDVALAGRESAEVGIDARHGLIPGEKVPARIRDIGRGVPMLSRMRWSAGLTAAVKG